MIGNVFTCWLFVVLVNIDHVDIRLRDFISLSLSTWWDSVIHLLSQSLFTCGGKHSTQVVHGYWWRNFCSWNRGYGVSHGWLRWNQCAQGCLPCRWRSWCWRWIYTDTYSLPKTTLDLVISHTYLCPATYIWYCILLKLDYLVSWIINVSAIKVWLLIILNQSFLLCWDIIHFFFLLIELRKA